MRKLQISKPELQWLRRANDKFQASYAFHLCFLPLYLFIPILFSGHLYNTKSWFCMSVCNLNRAELVHCSQTYWIKVPLKCGTVKKPKNKLFNFTVITPSNTDGGFLPYLLFKVVCKVNILILVLFFLLGKCAIHFSLE